MANLFTGGSSSEPNRIPPQFASAETRRKALKLFKSGLGYKRVAKILGLSPHTVRDWSRAFKKGAFSTEISENQYRYDGKTKELVLQLRKEGRTWAGIESITGVAKSTCRMWVCDAECLQEDAGG